MKEIIDELRKKIKEGLLSDAISGRLASELNKLINKLEAPAKTKTASLRSR